jgi:hypothetical protein
MPTIWDYCKTCGKKLSDAESNTEKFRDCKKCRTINLIVLSFVALSVILILFLGAYHCTRNWLGLIGFIFDIIGAYLLATGYLETMVQAASGFGGGGDIIRNLKGRHSFKIWSGLIFLILGFLFQAIKAL